MQPIKTTTPKHYQCTERGATRRARRAAFRADTLAAWYISTGEGKKRSWSADLRASAWQDWLRVQKVLCSPIGADILARARMHRFAKTAQPAIEWCLLSDIQRILFIGGFGTQGACEELAAYITTAIENGNPDVAQARATGAREWDVDMNMWFMPGPQNEQDEAEMGMERVLSAALNHGPSVSGQDAQAASLSDVPHICLTPRLLSQRPIPARATRAGCLLT